MKHYISLTTILAMITIGATISLAGDQSTVTVKTAIQKDSTVITGAAARMQTTCPVMEGNKIDKQYFADYQGDRVYFCCPVCVAKFKQNPEKYIQKLKEDGVTLDKTPAKE